MQRFNSIFSFDNLYRVLLGILLSFSSPGQATITASGNTLIECRFSPYLTCSDKTDGTPLWQNTAYRDPVRFSIANGSLFISRNNTSASYELATGTRQWEVIDAGNNRYFYPVVDQLAVYLAREDGMLEKRQADSGALLWSRKLSDGWVYPPVVHQGLVVTGGQNRIVWAIDSSSGQTVGQLSLGQELVAPLFQAGETFVASTFDNRLRAFRINEHRITPLWEIRLAAPAFASLEDGQRLVTADMSGSLTSINFENGQVAWQRKVHDNARFWNLLHQHKIISLTHSGALSILDADDGNLLSQWQLDRPYAQAAEALDDAVTVYDTSGRKLTLPIAARNNPSPRPVSTSEPEKHDKE